MIASHADKARTSRACGGCSACCVVLPIPAGEVGPGPKAAGAPCPHLGGAGCAIYALRPPLCAKFRCAWLADPSWPKAWRPDRSGLLCLREKLEGGVPAAVVYEIVPGALQRPEAAEIIEAIHESTAMAVVVDSRGGRRAMNGAWRIDPPRPGPPAPRFLLRRRAVAEPCDRSAVEQR